MEQELRELNDRERGVLEALLEVEFPNREEWRTQLNSMKVRQVSDDGTLILHPSGGRPLPTHYAKLGVEAMYKDADGGDVAILLHADGKGFLRMLEVLKYGSSPLVNPPSAEGIRVLLPENPGVAPPSASG